MWRLALVTAALVVTAHACCYTLQSNPMAANVPVYTWYLDTLSHRSIKPTDCVGQLHAVDRRSSAAALSACEMTAVEYMPMARPELGWRAVNTTEVQRVMFTQPCVGFGPYKAGDPASWLLLHTLSDSWVRLQLRCDDSPFESCVHFGLRLRQAAESRLVAEEQSDPILESCVRTPSPTPSRTPTPSQTASAMPTPSPTALPEYSAVFRIEATLSDSVFVALQLGLNYQRLKDTEGREGAHWCSTPVLDAQRTHVMTTLFPEDSGDQRRGIVSLVQPLQDLLSTEERVRVKVFGYTVSEDRIIKTRGLHSHSLLEWAHQAVAAESAIIVTVVWQQGGFCRVSLTKDNDVAFLGCRLFVGPQVYEEVTWAQIMPLDARAVPLCGTVVTANEPELPAEPAPTECSIQLGWRVDPQRSLVRLRGGKEYAEARVAWMACADGTERPRLERVSSLLNIETRESTECHIDSETHARAVCGENQRVVVAIAGTTCESVESDGFEVITACGPSSEAVLLVE